VPAMRAFALMTALVGLVSCSTVDVGGGGYPSMKVYEPSSRAYHLHYAAPPWAEPKDGTDYGSFHPSLVMPLVVFGHETKLDAYILQVDFVSGVAAEQAMSDIVALARGQGEVIDYGPRPFATAAGDEGFELGSHDGGGGLLAQLPEDAQSKITDHGFTIRARRVAIGTDGGSFQILVISVFVLDEPDLTYMLESFEPRPSGSTGS
jgi:hypothetical protein